MSRGVLALLCLCAVGASACATTADSAPAPTPLPPSTTTTLPATTTSSTSATTSTTSTSTSTTTSTSIAPTTTAPPPPLPAPALPATDAAFDRLAAANAAATMTVARDGQVIARRAAGTTIDGAAATSDSPMVVASVSKFLTAMMVARLDQAGLLDIDAPLPWRWIGLDPHPAWSDVTPRELLHHTSGMPVVRPEWFVPGAGECVDFLPTLLVEPPRAHRGNWTYSNGNYCALGLLVERLTARPLDRAAQALLLDPNSDDGIHLSTSGQRADDVGYRLGVERLDRLGGAGSFIVSTDDLVAAMSTITGADRALMTWPGVFADQYGWGHTGTVDGAKSCVWVMEAGRTIVAATIAGDSPSTGGAVCDRVVEALAIDLGFPADRPDRSPP